LILRYLFDPSGAWNVADALGRGATRTTRVQIKNYLDPFNPASTIFETAATSWSAVFDQNKFSAQSFETVARTSDKDRFIVERRASDHDEPANTDDVQALDGILQQWNPSTTQEARTREIAARINRGGYCDEAGAVDELFGQNDRDWFLLTRGDRGARATLPTASPRR
jgi:hypothetical protein